MSFTEPKDDGAGHFTFELKTAKVIGKAEVSVALQNGDAKRQTFIDVIIDSEAAKNAISGSEAEMRNFNEDYVTGASY